MSNNGPTALSSSLTKTLCPPSRFLTRFSVCNIVQHMHGEVEVDDDELLRWRHVYWEPVWIV
eukprot:2706949-Amphidinium_carterae.2